MQRVSKGYTIVEVLIFLAVSAIMFISATALIKGRQANAQFSDTARNLSSKLQDWMNDAQTGFPGGVVGQNYCHIQGSKIRVDSGTPPPGYSPDCIFLGKAIQITDSTYNKDQASKFFAYSIFGRRVIASGPSAGELTTDLSEADPVAAIGNNGGHGGSADLTEEYDMPAYITVKKVTSSGVSNSHLAGFYNRFNTEQSTTSNGAEDLTPYQYDIDNKDPKSKDIFDCINNFGACAKPPQLTDWEVCITDDQYYAVISITSTSGIGVNTKLSFAGSCP